MNKNQFINYLKIQIDRAGSQKEYAEKIGAPRTLSEGKGKNGGPTALLRRRRKSSAGIISD